jgi:hypothetical protein
VAGATNAEKKMLSHLSAVVAALSLSGCVPHADVLSPECLYCSWSEDADRRFHTHTGAAGPGWYSTRRKK